jgi:serine protease Do
MHVQPVQPSELRALRVPNGRGGAIVTDVTPLGPAFQAALSEGDVILTVQGQEVHSVEEVTKALNAIPAGRTARLVVWHSENGAPGQETLIQIRKR